MAANSTLAEQPLFNIRSVTERTGIAPETLRAWERRYGFPKPHRNEKGYRLYSEDEIAALKWLKVQTEAGMTIGQATRLLSEMRARGQDPVETKGRLRLTPRADFRTAEELSGELLHALLGLDQKQASLAIRKAITLHSLEDAMLKVISPTMVTIGEMWHDGEIPVALEHFASSICRAHLLQAMETLEDQELSGMVVAACAPGEYHELGLLMLTLLLLERGINVTYLGANLSLERLAETLAQLQPQMVLFSATSPHNAEALEDLNSVLEKLPEPRPAIGLGGLAFLLEPTLTNRVPGTFFGPGAQEAVRQIEQVLAHMPQ
jgi:DNA-binding transcriptional MerR regulator/methylmalonyl-CoA mutase cobalamin-binding subunit